MWVKICANTNLDDAQLAAELGADAVGFVFAPSMRQVTTAQVARITPHLPEELERVGVFAGWDANQIAAAVEQAGLTTVQLHGGFDAALLRGLSKRFEGRIRLIQTVHWVIAESGPAREQAEAQVRGHMLHIKESGMADRVLVDSKIGAAAGGTGVAFDWKAARGLFSSASPSRLILAGGLTPVNVAEAIVQLEPWGVDVASGVEASPGRKDAAKVAALIRAAKLALPEA
jgi:phosphoribosylanthranilate isomerase